MAEVIILSAVVRNSLHCGWLESEVVWCSRDRVPKAAIELLDVVAATPSYNAAVANCTVERWNLLRRDIRGVIISSSFHLPIPVKKHYLSFHL